MRAASATAFSPFRSVRSGGRHDAALNPRRSQGSIARWFGGASDSDDEDQDDDIDASRHASALSDDEPAFLLNGAEESAVLDSGSDRDEIPIPGGERVSDSTIDARAAAGERWVPDREPVHYSPPQQDEMGER